VACCLPASPFFPAAGRDIQNKLKTAEAGAIPLLVGLMGEGQEEATRQAAASALR
jgi:hypothetical protein